MDANEYHKLPTGTKVLVLSGVDYNRGTIVKAWESSSHKSYLVSRVVYDGHPGPAPVHPRLVSPDDGRECTYYVYKDQRGNKHVTSNHGIFWYYLNLNGYREFVSARSLDEAVEKASL